ncbi:arsenate reductase ArsC [Acidaminobacter sp. JC074]|uniref:arsenate reductase ArsC n=1 Tax=Acidaminobacter sp. JC074 TaxID=2530199 RepID=UPI001F0D3E17|nr:arsenate reductase ArsC [Acidaminobacter sp. JC074]MCH4887629.1 arsenate reductase ArsC [Acidaminobacter sp. JC074]
MIKIAFVCVHNSCRSQMAEGYAKSIGKDVFEAYSAGTEEYGQVKPLAVEVMEEDGVDMSSHHPKLLTDIPEELDIVITMGCNVVCPFVPNRYQEDWGLDDPSGGPIEDFRQTRDIIKEKMLDLIKRLENNEITLAGE